MKVLIDNGHGITTAGKRSPDGRLLEYKYTREIAAEVVGRLRAQGIDAEQLTPEPNDTLLKVRVSRVNAICSRLGAQNVLVVSIHCNAAGNHGWNVASGWSAHVSLNASARSKELAGCLADEVSARHLRLRMPMPRQKYWEQNLAICRDTKCPAVLTENFFMDSLSDVNFLLSDEGREAVVGIHVDAIRKFIGR